MNKISLLLDDGDTIRRICSIPDLTAKQVEQGVLAAFADDIPHPGRPGEPVTIRSVDPDELAKWTNEPIEVGQDFPSVGRLARALKFTNASPVSQALTKAKEKGDKDAELRGVVFRYVKDDLD